MWVRKLLTIVFTCAMGIASLCAAIPGAAADAKKAETKGAATKGPKTTYDEHVRPIFRDKCFACHNTEKKTAGLDLTTYSSMMAGGGSGAVVDPGNSSDSYLFSLVSHTSEPHMPPKSDKLPADLLATIAKWIEGGALENSGSKAAAPKKPKMDFALKGAPTGRPAGPPPMPDRMVLEPVVHAQRSTAPRTIATNPWSTLAAVAGQKQVLLYDMKSLDLVGVLPFPEGVPYVLKFSRNGLLLLAGGGHAGASGRVVVWNVKTGERVFEVGEEVDAVLGADISADQSLIALGGPSKIVRVYSTADGTLKYSMKKHTDWIYSVSFSPDGVLLATADRNGGLIVWEAPTGREYLVLAGHASAVTSLSWRIDSNILASGSEDASIKLWEMQNGGLVKTWGAHGGGVSGVDFTRDGRLASCGRDRLARLWDQNGAAKTAYSGFADLPLCVAFSDEANRLLVGEWSGAISVWNAADGKRIGSLDANPPKLADRLTDASKQIAVQEVERKKRSDQFAVVQAALEKERVPYGAAQKAAADAAAKLKPAQDAVTKAKAAVGTLSAELDSAAKTVAQLDPVIPALKAASDASAAAAAKVPGDKEISAAAEQVKNQFAKKNATYEAAKKVKAAKTAELAKVKSELAAAETALAPLATAAGAANKTLEKFRTDEAQAAGVKQAFEAANQSLAKAQHEVARWQGEIAFRDKASALAAHQAKLQQLADAAQSAQAGYEAAKAEIAKREAGVAAAVKNADAASAALVKSHAVVAQLTSEHEATVKRIGDLDALAPLLNETLAKAVEAGRRAPNDADILAEINQLKLLIAKKAGELELARTTSVDKTKAIEAAKALLPAADKKLADEKSAIETAKKRVVEATAALKPLADKLNAAKSVMSEASKLVEAVRKEVDALKTQRST